jgi:hypothetical protein
MSIRIGSRLTFLCLLAVFPIITFCHVPIVLAGEPQRVEVRSPDFSVVTDAGEKRGRDRTPDRDELQTG